MSGPDPVKLRSIAADVQRVMYASPLMRTVNNDWSVRTPALHFTLQQDRLQAVGLPSSAVAQQLQFLVTGIPLTVVREDIRTVQVVARSAGYRIEQAGSIEESARATVAMLPIFPIMLAATLIIIIFQVRSISAMVMVLLTSPLGLIAVVPTLILFQQPFGINALVGLVALSGILMRNTLILIGQIRHNAEAGLDPLHAVVEATVQRARPVILTALAAMLAFIPLTHSVFWGTLAYTLIGGTFAGTILALVFLPAMYTIWFRIAADSSRSLVAQVA